MFTHFPKSANCQPRTQGLFGTRRGHIVQVQVRPQFLLKL